MNKPLVYIAGIAGVIFLAIAVFYFITPANALPHFFPGYDASLAKQHYKHGIGALLIGLLLFAVAWFQSGKKSAQEENK